MEKGGESAVIWRFLPACEHDFLVEGFRPARVGAAPLVARAPPLAVGLVRGMQGCQGGELGQLALVEFVSVLCEEGGGEGRYGGKRKKKEGWEKHVTCDCGGLSESRRRNDVERTLLPQLAHFPCAAQTYVIC